MGPTGRVTVWATVQVVSLVSVVTQGSPTGTRQYQCVAMRYAKHLLVMKLCRTRVATKVSVVK